jgi:hypothetical protein
MPFTFFSSSRDVKSPFFCRYSTMALALERRTKHYMIRESNSLISRSHKFRPQYERSKKHTFCFIAPYVSNYNCLFYEILNKKPFQMLITGHSQCICILFLSSIRLVFSSANGNISGPDSCRKVPASYRFASAILVEAQKKKWLQSYVLSLKPF